MGIGEEADVERAGLKLTAVIAGAQRCGTTSLAQLLSTHPDVCLARDKEAHWFDNPEVQRSGTNARHFRERFAHHHGEPVVLDATPSYLFLPGCVEAMHQHNPDMKVIVILRDPVQRARSQYAHEVRRGVKLNAFWQVVLNETAGPLDRQPLGDESVTRTAALLARGRYSSQVARMLEWFPETLFLRFDELIEQPDATVRRITDYLNIDPFPEPVSLPWLNRSPRGWPSPLLNALVRQSLRADMRSTEDRLGWERGSLRQARR